MPSDGTRLDRRTVLQSLCAAATVGTGLTAAAGSAAATTIQRKRDLTRRYHDPDSLRSAFAEHGGPLRETLVSEGVVPADFRFEDLAVDLDGDVTGLEPTADDRRAGVSAMVEDGTTTALGMASTSTDTHEIALFVQPEREEAYALVEPRDGGDRLLVNGDDVTPTGCFYETCHSCCAVGYSTKKRHECDSDCQNCSVTETSCSCSDCGCTKEC